MSSSRDDREQDLVEVHPAPEKILVGILGIDRDAQLVDRIHRSVQRLNGCCDWDLLVVAREQDETIRRLWQDKGAEVMAIDDYEIRKRHNLWKVADKRNLVRETGRDRGYSGVMFVDGDVVFDEDIVREILDCSRYADVANVPYRIRWSSQYTVGILEGGKSRMLDLREMDRSLRFPRILGGSMGCTLLRGVALDVPFEPMELNKVAGEDIGFFYKLYTEHADRFARTTSWPFVADHLYD